MVLSNGVNIRLLALSHEVYAVESSALVLLSAVLSFATFSGVISLVS